jgi:tetratricopeptide (TPR) repeat protein
LVAAGLPVIVETGLILPEDDWQGHYTLISGYSDSQGTFTAQDSLRGPNFIMSEAQLVEGWRAFNYLFVVLYPPDRRAEVMTLLAGEADPQDNFSHAAERARQDIASTADTQAQAFAWFNLGTSLAALEDYADAASAFDQALARQLPFRILWYQPQPLEAYFAVGRFQDVIMLSESALTQADNLEEAHYWRGRARLALGDQDDAIADWRTALRYNRNYADPARALSELGLAP